MRAWLRESRPSWGWMLLLAPLWALRGFEAWSRQRAGAGLGLAVFVAFVWDVLLVSAVIGLTRAATSRTGQPRSLGVRVLRTAARVVCCGLLGWDLAFRAADAFYASATGGAFNSSVFVYL